MYWKDLCGISPWTFCPNCNSRQLPTPEEREPEEEPDPEPDWEARHRLRTGLLNAQGGILAEADPTVTGE